MADQLSRSMTCPGCGKDARVVLTVQPPRDDGVQRMAVESYTCPEGDFTTEARILQALGYA